MCPIYFGWMFIECVWHSILWTIIFVSILHIAHMQAWYQICCAVQYNYVLYFMWCIIWVATHINNHNIFKICPIDKKGINCTYEYIDLKLWIMMLISWLEIALMTAYVDYELWGIFWGRCAHVPPSAIRTMRPGAYWRMSPGRSLTDEPWAQCDRWALGAIWPMSLGCYLTDVPSRICTYQA